MSEIKDGGQAFPMAANEYAGHGPCWGMTLRDYFAAKAAAAFIAATDYQTPLKSAKNEGSVADAVAETAYMFADAMLRAREAS